MEMILWPWDGWVGTREIVPALGESSEADEGGDQANG